MSVSSPEKSFRWSDKPKARKQEFAELLDVPAFKDLFNEKYFEGLERRKDFLVGRAHKMQAVQLLTLLLLGLAVLSVHLSVSFFGLSTAESRNVREVLLVVSSSVQLFNIFSVTEQMYIRELLDTYVRKLSKGNDIARRALEVRYGLGASFVFSPVIEGWRPTGRQALVVVAAFIGLIGWLLMAFVGAILIQIAAMIDIIREPTISTKVSVFVIIYVVAVDLASLGIQAMSGGFGAGGDGTTAPKGAS